MHESFITSEVKTAMRTYVKFSRTVKNSRQGKILIYHSIFDLGFRDNQKWK